MKAIFALLAVAALINVLSASAEDDALSRSLRKIRYEHGGKDTNRDNQAEKALSLLKPESSPEEKGKIYSTVASIYSENGWAGQEFADKSAKYCEKALKYPVDAETTARLYKYWGSALEAGNRDHHLKGADFAALRKKIGKMYFAGLKVVSDNLKATDYASPPVGRFDFDCNSDSPACQEKKKQHAEQLKARMDAEQQNHLLDRRKELMRAVVDLYAREPYEAPEFEEQLAASISDEALRNQLRASREKLITIHKNIALGKAGDAPNQGSPEKSPIKKKMGRTRPQTPQ